MTVFKGYLLMAKRYRRIILVYMGIFLGISIMASSSMQKNSIDNFAATKLKLSVSDMDQSDLSKQVIQYLKKKHEVSVIKDDKEKMQEYLYYGKIDAAIRIKKGFEENAKNGKAYINVTQAPGSSRALYVEQQLNSFIENMLEYHLAGYTLEESYHKINSQKADKVSIMNLNGNGGETPGYSRFFNFLPYLLIAALGSILGMILVIFQKKEIRNRMMASKISLFRQNMEGISAFFIIGLFVYAVVCIFTILYYGKEFTQSNHFALYLLNGFIDMLTALAIAYIIGLLVNKLERVNMIVTPLALAISFTCGVFVPMEMISKKILVFSKFIPVYWYENANRLMSKYANPSASIRNEIWQSIGIQVLYVVALIGIAMVITKFKQQDK